MIGIRAPWKLSKFRTKWFRQCVGEMKQRMMRKFAPADFSEILAAVPRGGGKILLRGETLQGVPNLARADFTEMQVWRKARSADQVGTIAVDGVICE